MQCIHIRQQWHEPALVGSVVENRHFRCIFGPKLSALVSIFNGNGQSGLGGAVAGSWYTNPAAHQCSQHGEEPAVVAGDGTGELTVFVNGCEPIQHVFFGNAYIVKVDHPIVHTVESHFSATVFYGYACSEVTLLVSQGHYKSTHTIILAVNDQLGKNGGCLSVQCCIADVFLTRLFARCMDHEGSIFVIVDGSGKYTFYVGAVSGLCHGKAAGQFQRADVLQVFLMMFFSAQEVNAHSPEAKLHSKLDHHAQVVVAEGLHDGKVVGHTATATVLLGKTHGTEALLCQQLAPFQYFFPAFVQVIGISVFKGGVSKHGFYSVQYFCLRAIQKPGHGIHAERCFGLLLIGDGFAFCGMEDEGRLAADYAQHTFNFL